MSNEKPDLKEHADLEAQVFDAVRALGWVIPQTKDEVKAAEHDGELSKLALPERLRDPYALFDGMVPSGRAESKTRPDPNDAEPHVFGSFVQLLRREDGLSTEELATRARIDHAELLRIETDELYEPKPRTVHQLAEHFRLPAKALLKLSNLRYGHNTQLTQAAVRFAAHAKSIMKLTREEREALHEFVEFLSSME